VKAPVVQALEEIFGGAFVGSHPMAGSEKSGLEAARGDLFENAACVVTPTARTVPAARAAVENLWTAVGGRLVHLAPAEHDRLVGRISHLPHSVAAVLVHAVAQTPGADRLAGGGYRDTTRIAAGPPAMWAEILLQNREGLLAGIDGFAEKLAELKTILLSNDAPALENFLSRAKAARDALK
jgi:prephenate dehydrogenase